jgi:hypothetical protein
MATVFAGALLFAGVVANTMPATAPIAVEDSHIYITFRGLMVFDKEMSAGKQIVRLESGERDHQIAIRIKCPTCDSYLNWGHDYPQDANITLTVSGGTVIAPRWTTPLPFEIASLHLRDRPSEGELIMLADKFTPTIEVNTGTFSRDELKTTYFSRDSEPDTPDSSQPRVIKLDVRIQEGQRAVLSAKEPLKRIEVGAGGAEWFIEVNNTPDLSGVCDYYHFTFYYDGLGFLKNGRIKPVDPSKRYKAKGRGMESDDCPKDKDQKFHVKAIETRPCIPISY